MPIRRIVPCFALAAAALISASGCGGGSSAPPSAVPPLAHHAAAGRTATLSVIPCSQIRTLSGLHDRLQVAKNPATGDSVEYLVVGDGARSNDLLVMFPGTGQILPGWPVQLITNAKYSPKITGTIGYRASEDGAASLCHDYRLLLFDYPGVGKTSYVANLTRDRIANDIDAVLNEVAIKYGIDTSLVDPAGWSLGTTMALKYSVLSPVARPARKIHDLLLLATGPGGSMQGDETHDSAACVQTLFNDSLSESGSVEQTILRDLSELIFPFRRQLGNQNGTHSGCSATVSSSGVTLSVKLKCTRSNGCIPYLAQSILDEKTYPWSITKGLGSQVYIEERQQASDWYLDYCARAGANFTSLDCTSYGTVQMSATNGGVCRTNTKRLNEPVARFCDKIRMTGRITVLAGYEDLFDQWTYGRAVVQGYRRAQGRNAAQLLIYPGSAGHGLLIQHPGWAQQMMDAEIAGN